VKLSLSYSVSFIALVSVAIRTCFDASLGGDVAGHTGPVLDQERLAKPLGENARGLVQFDSAARSAFQTGSSSYPARSRALQAPTGGAQCFFGQGSEATRARDDALRSRQIANYPHLR